MRQDRGSRDGRAQTPGLRVAQTKAQGSGKDAWAGSVLTREHGPQTRWKFAGLLSNHQTQGCRHNRLTQVKHVSADDAGATGKQPTLTWPVPGCGPASVRYTKEALCASQP